MAVLLEGLEKLHRPPGAGVAEEHGAGCPVPAAAEAGNVLEQVAEPVHGSAHAEGELKALLGSFLELGRGAEGAEDVLNVRHLVDARAGEAPASPLALRDEALQEEHLLAVLDREACLHPRTSGGLDDDGPLAHAGGDDIASREGVRGGGGVGPELRDDRSFSGG